MTSYGSCIVIALSAFVLFNQPKYLVAYLVFVYIERQINYILWIQQPANHAQSVFFSLTFVYLVKHCIYLLLVGLFLAALIVINQVKVRTIPQLCIGAGVGVCLAVGAYYSTHRLLNNEYSTYIAI